MSEDAKTFKLDLEDEETAHPIRDAIDQVLANEALAKTVRTLRADGFTLLQIQLHPELIEGWEEWERAYKYHGVSSPSIPVNFGKVQGVMYTDNPYYIMAPDDTDESKVADLPLLAPDPFHTFLALEEGNMETVATYLAHDDGTHIKPDEEIGRPREGDVGTALTLRDMGMAVEDGALVTFREKDGDAALTLGDVILGMAMLRALIKSGFIKFLETATPGEEEADALTIRGGAVFSQLTRAATRRNKTKTVTLKNRQGKEVATIQGLKDALALKPSSRKTFTLLDREATRMSMAGEYRHDGETVCRAELSVKDVAKLYGITERSAKNRLRRDFKAIANETLTIEKRGKGGGWVTIPVAGGTYGIRGDRAAFTFSPDVMTYLFNPTASQIDLPPELFATDDTNHPAAFQIGVKLYTHDNQNHGEAAPDRLKLTTLLNAARELPTPEELAKGRRSKTERIMGPFEAAMEHLVDVGALKAWDYCHENGEQLTDEEYQTIETERELGRPTPWELAEGWLVTWELGRRYPKHEAARMASREKRLGEKVAAKAKREKEAEASARRIRGKKETAIAKAMAEEELGARQEGEKAADNGEN